MSNGYRQPNVSSWGGSVIYERTAAGGMYHMFVEEIVNNCGLDTYARNMRVAHAVSKSAAGPYAPANLVANFSASTPHAVRDPGNGDWLVFATGCGYAPFTVPPPFCAMGKKADFVYLIATMPGTCIGGDTSFTKPRKLPRRFYYILLLEVRRWLGLGRMA